MVQEITLPPLVGSRRPPRLPQSRQITLIGANGSGKTRLMKWIAGNAGEKAFVISSLNAFTPRVRNDSRPLSDIERLFLSLNGQEESRASEGMSELEMLTRLILSDEFRYLLQFKAEKLLSGKTPRLEETRLDILVRLWENIFPGNQVIKHQGEIRFTTGAGDDVIPALKLSQGEKTVLFYILAALYAPEDAIVFIDDPTLFLHPAILNSLWNAIENLRKDAVFVYNTNDVEFLTSRTDNLTVWVKRFDSAQNAWDYELIDPADVSDDLLVVLMGSRNPVLFIEGDAKHSLDAKLYPLVFSEFTVRPLGSCDRVIESTRTFRSLNTMHHLDSHGIVDRDRRTPQEVDYLRGKGILVPEVAEIENIFLLEDVIKTMAQRKGKNPDIVFRKVKEAVMKLWQQFYKAQALMHTRHRVKRLVECKIDARFTSISQLEDHLDSLHSIIRPHYIYDTLLQEFRGMIGKDDYPGILRYFNHKPMLAESGIPRMLGYSSVNEYISGVLAVLKGNGRDAARIRASVRQCFRTGKESITEKNTEK